MPNEGLHRYVDAPNDFGEILEWVGWALATWSFAGGLFAIYIFANLAPRACSNLKWYRDEFADYPAERKALISGIWQRVRPPGCGQDGKFHRIFGLACFLIGKGG